MNSDDIVQIQDVVAARQHVLRTRQKVLVTSAAATLGAAILVFLMAFYLVAAGAAVATLGAAIFAAIGALVFVHWARHYHSILQQLADLDQRVAQGETVYGSQVAFHSYRRAA